MPRFRVRQYEPGEVPAELRDVENPVWESDSATGQFMLRLGLTGQSRLEYLPDEPAYRHDFVARLWAEANGVTRTLSSGRVFPDITRMRELGVANSYATRERARRLLDSG